MRHALRGNGYWPWIVGVLAAVLVLGYIQYEIRFLKELNDALAQGLAEEQAATRARGDRPVAPGPSELARDPDLRGEPGRGIAGVVAQGCSIRIRYTDASTETVGPLCGADGSPGPRGSVGPSGSPGADGVSITDATTDGCDVVISFSDGQTRRVGPFCGPPGEDGEDGRPGRSIIGVDCRGQGGDSNWVFTFKEPDGSVTEETVDGPCRVSGPGSPSPTPPPFGGD